MPIAFAVKSSHHLSPFCCYVCLSVCVLDVRVKNKKKESRVLNYLSINLRCVVCVCDCVIVLYFLNGMAAVLCCAVPCVFLCVGYFFFYDWFTHTRDRQTDRRAAYDGARGWKEFILARPLLITFSLLLLDWSAPPPPPPPTTTSP